ncbi:MAG TPA: hypothetical protein VFJ85_15105 [Acidimicrobiales bacterium]|nr:hypothetical protein [Acidimicrobiales bacterium]
MDEQQAPEGKDTRSRRIRSGLVAAGAAAGLTLAGLGVAAGQTDGTTSIPPESGTTQAPVPNQAAPAPPMPGPGPMEMHMKGPGGPHMGMGMGIHGEFTTRGPNGGWQTIATQRGEVTAVTHTSLTVKSEDGFSRTYAVDDNTMVGAGNEGIDDVKTGDKVDVVALVVDGKASAVEVHDATQDQQLHQRWAPAPPPKPMAPGNPPAPSTTPTTTS